MPSTAPEPAHPMAAQDLQRLGGNLRAQRQSLRLAAQSVARAANVSRQTLHRIEHGEPSVTMGAYLNVARALGLELALVGATRPGTANDGEPAVRLADYPQLGQLAWHRQSDTLTEEEALALYERHWRHVDTSTLEPAERRFIAHLAQRHGKGALLV